MRSIISFLLLVLIATATANAQEPAPSTRVSAGLAAPRNLYPFSLRLAVRGLSAKKAEFFCNAVLISPEWAVTTAHCMGASKVDNLSVYFGNTDSLEREVSLREAILHPEFENKGHRNDIALIRLANPVSDPAIAIAEPATRSASKDPRQTAGQFIAAGWGAMTETERIQGNFISAVQRHLNVSLVAYEECNGPRMYAGKVAPGQLCAASGIVGTDVCLGFSGAPLMVPNRRGKFELQGLVSWGNGCGLVNYPTVYTDVSYFAPWIRSTIEKHTPADPPAPVADTVDPKQARSLQLLDARIVDTDKTEGLAPAGAFRYAVSIGVAGKNQSKGHFCGGILLNRRWVLTAAHCVYAYASKEGRTRIQIKVDTDVLSYGGVKLGVSDILIHPDFHQTPFRSFVNDVALVAVSGAVPTDIYVPPLLTPEQEQRFAAADAEATVIGWGKDAFSAYGRISNYLHMATVPIRSNNQCNGPTAYKGLVDDHMLCAGGNGVDACQGDSGGPLLVIDDQTDFMIAGLVSWGEGCGDRPTPGVYTRLSSYLTWIRDNTTQ